MSPVGLAGDQHNVLARHHRLLEVEHLNVNSNLKTPKIPNSVVLLDLPFKYRMRLEDNHGASQFLHSARIRALSGKCRIGDRGREILTALVLT